MEEAPVKEGEVVDVKIDSVGDKGDGIARVEGFVVIVPGTNKGDEVKVKINKVLRNVGFGEVVGKIEKKKKPKKEKKDPLDYDPEIDSEDFGSDLEE